MNNVANFLFYEQLYKKCDTANGDTSSFVENITDSKKFLFLWDTKKFLHESSELREHFIGDYEEKREKIVKYFRGCNTEYKYDLFESLYKHFLSNINLYSEIASALQDFKNENELNEFVLKRFFKHSRIENFIINQLRYQGTYSAIFRLVLAFKCNLNIKVCIEITKGKFELIESHNSAAPNEVLILLKSNKFSILRFEQERLENFYRRQELNRKFQIMSYILRKFDIDNEYKSEYGEDYKQILKHIKRNYNYFTPNTPKIMDLDQLKGGIDYLYDCIRPRLKRILYTLENDGKIYYSQVYDEDLENYSDKSKYATKQEDNVELYIKQFLSYIVMLKGTPIIRAIFCRLKDKHSIYNFEEFLTIVKAIFTLLAKSETFVETLTFMILGNDQKLWIPEMIITKIEGLVGVVENELKIQWKRILGFSILSDIIPILLEKLLKFSESFDSDCETKLSEITILMENLMYFDNSMKRTLEDLNLTSWKMITTASYWDSKLEVLKMYNYKSQTLNELKIILEDISNRYGIVAKEILEIFTNKMFVERNFKFNFLEFLSNFNNGKWTLSDIVIKILKSNLIQDWLKMMQKHFGTDNVEMNAELICNLIDSSDEATANIKSKIFEIKTQVQQISSIKCSTTSKKIFSMNEREIKEWCQQFKIKRYESTTDIPPIEPLAIVSRVFELMNNVKFRDTQLFAILSMWYNERGVLTQVSTGEGKTFVGVAFSVLKFLYEERIDIITSSSVLAVRDATCHLNKRIFNFFGIKVDYNCNKKQSERMKVYEENHIVYGTLTDFQRDYLSTAFYEKEIMSKNKDYKYDDYHHFQNVLIDEVDSMVLDQGNNILYISEDIPNIDDIESIFVFLRAWINQHFDNPEGLNVKIVEKIILFYMYGRLDFDDLARMIPGASPEEIMQKLKDSNIIDAGNMLDEGLFDEEKIKTALAEYGQKTLDKICSYFKPYTERYKIINVPNYQKSFVLKHLNKWIESAIKATSMKPGKGFIVKSKSGEQKENPNIIIVDIDTGTLKRNTHFCEGLHQQLQIKYGCELSLISIKGIFISNISFLNKYSNFYGMTGTLGNSEERKRLTKMYKIDYVTIPRHYSRNFTEQSPISEPNIDNYFEMICTEVKNMLSSKRSVLIICETIRDTKILEEFVSELLPKSRLIVYNLDNIEFSCHNLKPGYVIIATNLAGRGTDIKVSDELNKNGGLHVIVTFLPANTRIEEQAFGRAARGKSFGSGRLIVNENQTAAQLKQARNQNELRRLDQVIEYYDNFIKIEEDFFKKFQDEYKILKHKERSKLYLQNFLIQWILWLDKNSILLEDPKKRAEVNRSFDKFLKEKEELHPVIRVELFKEYDLKCDFWSAKQILNENFQADLFVHQYYKVYEIIKESQLSLCVLRDLTSTEKRHLKICLEMVTTWKTSRNLFICVVNTLIEKYENELPALDAFRDQQKQIIDAISLFERSIKMLLGMEVTSDIFSSIVDNEVFKTILWDGLMDSGCLQPSKVKKIVNLKEIRNVAEKYNIPFRKLKNFLENYEQKEIKSLNDFGEDLKNNFKFASRTEFWNILVSKEILNDEIHYAIIDMEVIEKIDPSAGEIIKKLPKVELSAASHLQVFFYPLQEKVNNKVVVKMGWIKNEFSQKRIDFLLEYNVMQINMEATFNIKKFKHFKQTFKITKYFNNFDEIDVNDFSIICNDYEEITKKLQSLNVLMPRDNISYALNYCKFKIFQNPDDLGEYFIYHSEICKLIKNKFAYRIAFEKLGLEVIKKKFYYELDLDPYPHISIIGDFFNSSLISPAKVKGCKEFCPSKYFTTSQMLNRMRSIGIDPDDDKSSKTKELLFKSLNILRSLGKEIQKTLISFINPLNNRDRFQKPEVYLDPIDTHLPGNNSLDFMKQKGLTHVINFREKKEEKKEKKEKKFNLRKIILYAFAIVLAVALVIVISYAVAGFAPVLGSILNGARLLLQGSRICTFLCYFMGISSKALSSKIIISSSFIKLTTMATSFYSLCYYVPYAIKFIERKSYTGEETSKEGENENPDDENIIEQGSDSHQIDPNELMQRQLNALNNALSPNWLSNFINSIFNTVVELISKIGEKIRNFIIIKFPIIGNLIETFFKIFKNSDLVIKMSSIIIAELSKIVIELCKKLSSEIINKFNDISKILTKNFNSLLSKLKIDDKTIDELVKDFYNHAKTLFEITGEEIKKDWAPTNESEDEVNYEKEKEKIKKTVLDELVKQVSRTYDENKETEIIEPVINHANDKATEMAEKHLEQQFNPLNLPTRSFDNKSNLQKLINLSDNEVDDVDDIFFKEFLSRADSIINTTNDPDVYADIIQQNVPMDMVGINATRLALEKVFGLSFRIIVKYNGNQIHFGDSDDGDTKVINIELVEGHFINTVQKNQNSCDNNCLMDAIADQFPEMKIMSSANWRKIIARVIRTNSDIREIIQNRAHTFNREDGFIGGNLGQDPRRNLFQQNQNHGMNQQQSRSNQQQNRSNQRNNLRLGSHYVGAYNYVRQEIRFNLLPGRMEINHMLTFFAWDQFAEWCSINDPDNRILRRLAPFLNRNGRPIRNRMLSMPLYYIVHRNLASTLSMYFREDQRDHLINGEVHLAYRMDIGDQQNTILQIYEEFGHLGVFYGQSLEEVLDSFQEMCLELIWLALLIGILDEWQYNYLVNYIDNLGYNYDQELKKMYERKMKPPKEGDY